MNTRFLNIDDFSVFPYAYLDNNINYLVAISY